MRSVIIGTAGHIDHGKTALVRALTGIDPDRLDEEKRRGITIDLGFAHLELPGRDGETLSFGFVDVPGHERFVRNMLAGIGGIDLVLLVIAADEGIKPQTREHFDICRLLGLQRGIAVLTKSDLVDAETLEVARLEVQEFLRGSFMQDSPVVPVSSRRETGLEELRSELVRAGLAMPARDSEAIIRLPIDRAFTMKGFGTVVTGTLVSGTVRREDELAVFPCAHRVRVRGIQVHGRAANHATAGQRTALNVAGIRKEDLERGMTLSLPGVLQSTSRVDVKVSLLDSSKPLKSGGRVHFHAFSSETIAGVAVYESKEIRPGAEGFAHLRLQSPQLLLPGDRFIIRQFSPVITIGGGTVLDATPQAKIPTAARVAFLRIQDGQDQASAIYARIQRCGEQGITVTQLTAETGLKSARLENLLSALSKRGVTREVNFLLVEPALQEIVQRLSDLVRRFHDSNPLVPGISREALRAQASLSPLPFEAGLAASMRQGRLKLTGDLVHLAGRSVTLGTEDRESRRIIEHAFASAGLKVPNLKDVLAGLKIDPARAQKIVTLLLREKVLVKVSEELVFHASSLAELRRSLASERLRSPRLDVARFKELTGVSRKYAIPLLEYLDRERITLRQGEARVIL